MHQANTQSNRGRFQKGYDPRRHVFTRDECVEGFWAMVSSIVERYPNAAIWDGSTHMVINALPYLIARKPRKDGTP